MIKSLKNCGAKVSSGGFLVNNNFKIKGIKNIYTSGILAHGFNPERKTIIQAILKNSEWVGKDIAKTLARSLTLKESQNAKGIQDIIKPTDILFASISLFNLLVCTASKLGR